MYGDMDDTYDVDEDFFGALALLHSTEDDSAERLRKMLDATIERKYGTGRTLAARMPKKFLQNPRIREKTPVIDATRSSVDSRKSFKFDKPPAAVSNANENGSKPAGPIDVAFEDYTEKGDIPRISIPDEGSNDGLLCKICNGARLGPLILLECQECQEVYHPLCHQPPVVDIDVYDPRIVWRCTQCVELPTTVSPILPLSDEKKLNKCRRSSDAFRTREISTKIDGTRSTSPSVGKNGGNFEDRGSRDLALKGNSTFHDSPFAKDFSGLMQKGTRTSSSNQLRKRIGSKLTVSRTLTK